MHRIRNNPHYWKRRWPWRWFIPLRVNDRFCRECGLPYHEGPLPEAVDKFRDGDVEIQRFTAGSHRRGDYMIRVGRWKGSGRRLFLSEFFPERELDVVIDALCRARKEWSEPRRHRRDR